LKNTVNRSAFVGAVMSALSFGAIAQSSVSLSGTLTVDVARGNGGTTPLYGSGGEKRWTENDIVSHLNIGGKEDLGGGLYAGFDLQHFFLVDTGADANQTAGTFFDGRALVKLGGRYGEIYLGREYTPAFYTAVVTDPWLWDTSMAQIGYLQWANYFSTSGVRTNNSIGYISPSVGGVVARLMASAGEGAASGKDVGGSLTFSQDKLWASIAFDQHKNVNGVDTDRLMEVAASYDFGVVKPSALYARSKVAGVDYSAYSLAVNVPAGGQGQVRAAVSHISDWNTATPQKDGLTKASVGYIYYLSKRTYLHTNVATAKGETATRTTGFDAGISHTF
jgi:predicted porin